MRAGAETVAVNVKLERGSVPGASVKALTHAPGVLRVEQSFPEELDEDLSTLYVLEVERPLLPSALRALRAAPGVEYAEEAAPRKLLRSS